MTRIATPLHLVLLAAALPSLAAAEEQRTFARLFVNGQEHGDVLIVLRARDALCQPDDLREAGLRDLSGHSETIEGKPWLSLASLAPAVTWEFDPRLVALRLTATPEHLARTRIDFERSIRPPGIVYGSAPSAFLNYGIQTTGGDRPTGSAELGTSFDGALFDSVASVRPDGKVLRGFSTLTLDSPSNLRRAVLGDSLAASGLLGSTMVLGGLTISREFSLDPYFVGAPRQQISGVTTTPSRVEVYTDGRLTRVESLPAGPFDLANLPGFGTGDQTRIVVRDSFGRTQEFSATTRISANLLAPGLSDYAYQIGFRRTALDRSFEYGAPAVLGRHRVGMTDWATGGVQFEGDRGVISGGPTLTASSPLGAFDFGFAGSTDGTFPGAAAFGSYGFTSRHFGASAQAIWMSGRYSNLALTALHDRPKLQVRLSASTAFSGISLTGGVAGSAMRDGGTVRQVFANTSARLFGPLNLFVDGSVQRSQGPSTWTVFAGLGLTLPASTQANTSYQTDGVHSTTAVQAQKAAPPVGTGFGYVFNAQSGAQKSGSADLQYQGSYGRYEAIYARSDTAQSWSLSAAGALVAIDGSVYATRPVQDGYALIQVPGVEGVRGYLNNMEVGRTDAGGNLLVPNVLPYYGNRLGITERDIPWNYSIAGTERTIAGPNRGGVVARFKVARVQAFTGSIQLGRGASAVVPASGQLTVYIDGMPQSFPIGLQGQFYLENVAPGTYRAEVLYGGKTCKLGIEIPNSTETVVDLGAWSCIPPEPLASAAPATSRGMGTVRGRLFVDLDGNGAYDLDEPVLEGVRVLLDGHEAQTDAEGTFVFSGMPAGATALRLANPLELPSGFALAEPVRTVTVPASGQELEVGMAVRRTGSLQDTGLSLILPSGDTKLRLSVLYSVGLGLEGWREGAAVSARQDTELQRLGSEVLDARNLRVLLVVQLPQGAAKAAWSSMLGSARGMLQYLQGAALVPRSRLLWTVMEASTTAPSGRAEVMLVRIDQARAEGPSDVEPCCATARAR